ncbi:MAG: MarR family transcriptional regulator [Oscillospiraceae bacterium]|nr:MarR family transcriptional regulator [Oscillospiraceae bacterium]MCI2035584.1 MarR family transcriptional regulator [Oscillospiraceae bacterium]
MTKSDDADAVEKLARAFLQFHYLHHYGKKIYIGKKADCFSLRPSDVMMLFAIGHAQRGHRGGVTATELSESLGIKTPSVNPVLSVLEKEGLILRATDSDDHRFVRITLSSRGAGLIRRFQKKFRAKLCGLVAYLGAEKSCQLAGLMDEVYGYLKQTARRQTEKTENR